MLTAKQIFRLGFLQKCADAGMTAEEATDFAETAVIMLKEARLAKEAQEGGSPGMGSQMMGWAGKGFDVGTKLLSGLGNLLVPVAIGAPPVAGVIAGHYLAKATDADDETIKAIRKKELIDEIRRNRLILEQKRRSYRPTS